MCARAHYLFTHLKFLQEPEFISSYITNHKRTQIKKRANFSPKARPFKDDDIIIVDEKGNKEKDELKVKFKLLQFCENYRPAYYGTCQKLSKVISPRNPFKKDEVSCLLNKLTCPGTHCYFRIICVF